MASVLCLSALSPSVLCITACSYVMAVCRRAFLPRAVPPSHYGARPSGLCLIMLQILPTCHHATPTTCTLAPLRHRARVDRSAQFCQCYREISRIHVVCPPPPRIAHASRGQTYPPVRELCVLSPPPVFCAGFHPGWWRGCRSRWHEGSEVETGQHPCCQPQLHHCLHAHGHDAALVLQR